MRKKKWLHWVTLIPVLAVAVMIFLFSTQSGTESSGTSGRIVKIVLEVSMPQFSALSVAEQSAWIEQLQFVIRKLAHFSEYAMLGFFLMLHIRVAWKVSKEWLWTLGLGVFYAATDEMHQLLVGSRSGQISDVVLDGLGVLFGIILLAGVWWMVTSIHHRIDAKTSRQQTDR